MRNLIAVAALALIVCVWASSARADAVDDQYIAGYAASTLKNDFDLPAIELIVNDGTIHVIGRKLSFVDQDRMLRVLSKIPGVKRVEVEQGLPDIGPGALDVPLPNPHGPGVEVMVAAHPWKFLASTSVFDPLLADPRWPNFSAAYDHYTGGNQNLKDVASVSFGDSISVWQSADNPYGQFEIGVQAGVFAIFNLNSASFDLVNADYFIGPILEYRKDDLSALLRVYHQSSHVGDEFLLAHPGFDRVNLSYEEIDTIVSYDLFHKSVRVYGGGGWLFGTDPPDLKKWAAQYGVELRGKPFHAFGGTMIPIAAVDLQNRQQNNWTTDISARVGVQFEDAVSFSKTMELAVEFYNGHSYNGQFFADDIQFIGLGLHFYP